MFFCSFSYRSKVIIKGASNIIGVGYGITRESTVGKLDATVFRETRDLMAFYVLFITPISFKIFVIISLFTFLHKGGE